MKKNLILFAFIFIFIGIKAQNEPLTENSIKQTLDDSRKNGTPEWEITRLNTALHKRMQKQSHNQSFGNSGLQKNIINPPHVNTSSCTNPGFENGTSSNWNLYSGDINGVNLPCNTCANTNTGAVSNVVNSTSTLSGQCTSGIDYYGSFPVVAPAPLGGNFSLGLNDASAGGKIEKASYSFVVNSTNDLFTFQYAAVLNSGGSSHAPNAQPYFQVEVVNSAGQAISSCTQYAATVPASGNLAGWVLSNHTAPDGSAVYYKPWSTVTIDLSAPSLQGQTVTVNFVVSDCNLGGHFGYCYIDADCGNPSNATSVTGVCGVPNAPVTMVGPPGYVSYQWYGPNPNLNTPIAGATSQTLTTTANVNDTFVVQGTFAAGCTSKFNVVVKPASINLSTSSISSCIGGAFGSVSAAAAGSGSYNYTWTSSAGSIGTNTTSISNLPPGTYTVHVTDVTNQCSPKDTTVNILGIHPTLQTVTTQLCGTQTILHAPNSFTNTAYQWYDNSNTLTSTTTQNYSVTNGTNGQHYSVTYLDSASHCLDSLKITLNQININFTPQKVNPCIGGNSGSLTFNASPNNSFSSYDWNFSGTVISSSNASNVTPPFSFPNLAAGTYTMLITAPGNTTCFYIDTVSLVNSGLIPLTVDSNHKVCNADVLVLNPNAAPTSSNSWTGTGLTYGANTGNSLTINTAFTNTVSGYYTYTDTISDSHNCKTVYKAKITVKSFNAKISIVEPLHCYHDSTGKLKTSVSGEKNGPIGNPDTYTFNWQPASSFTVANPATATGPNASSTKGGNLKAGTYTCVVSNGNCIETATVTLVDGRPLSTDSLYAYYCPKDSLALLVADTGNFFYQWHTNTGIVASATNDSLQVPTQNVNNYYVTYKHNGCADTAKVIIAVSTYNAFRPNELVNIFSPNGDGKNDFFYPFYQPNVNQYQIYKQEQSYELKVYNRWGTLMYETTEYNKPWDGKTKGGSDASDGSYFFVVKYQSNCGTKADLIEKKGFVELMR